jgi:hypothetical protein
VLQQDHFIALLLSAGARSPRPEVIQLSKERKESKSSTQHITLQQQ